MARKRSSDPLLDRAIKLTQLQFGDQTSSIMRAIKEAGALKNSQIRQARSGARYATDAERFGQKGIKDSYKAIGDAAAQSGQFMDKLTPVPDGSPGSAILAAIQSSRAAIPTTVAQQQAQAIADSEGRASRARAGGQFAEQAANVNFAGTVDKLRDQLSEVQGKAGLSVETTYQDLLDKYDAKSLKEAELAERIRHNQAVENKKPKGKSKWLTRVEQNTYITNVNKAYAWVQKLAASGASGKQVRELISAGGSTPRKTYTDPATGEAKSQAGDTVPGYGVDVARMAMDLFYNVAPGATPGSVRGTLTRTSKQALRRAGVKAPKSWLG